MGNKFTTEEIKQFIFDASQATYASGDESIKKKQSDGSTTIEFIQGDFTFHDNYFGGEPYGGREVVFHQGKAVWMMCTTALCISKSVMPKCTAFSWQHFAI